MPRSGWPVLSEMDAYCFEEQVVARRVFDGLARESRQLVSEPVETLVNVQQFIARLFEQKVGRYWVAHEHEYKRGAA